MSTITTALLSLFLLAATIRASEPVAVDGSDNLRDPLEVRALTEPEAVLQALPGAIEEARVHGDPRRQALLYLAQANACRVVADWSCQRDAGANAAIFAETSLDHLLIVRGLIAEARANIALKDYSRGERLLADAELRLAQHPSAELSADILLGYSSISYALGKHALSAEYAQRGLGKLGPQQALPMQARLLRNLARAQSELGNLVDAKQTLLRAQTTAERVVDPKLVAELALETARAARANKDVATQRKNGQRILDLANQLKNSQLMGLGHEVLGDAALDSGDRADAKAEYAVADASFHGLGLDRDELRVSRSLVRLHSLAGEQNPLAPLLRRMVELEDTVEKSDRAQAADDFDARLKYAQQEQDLAHLEREAVLAKQREAALARSGRFRLGLELMTVAIALTIILFYSQLRRANTRLRSTVAALHESETQAASLLRISKGLVFLHDEQGGIIMLNPAAASALGQPQHASGCHSFLDFLPAAGKEYFDHYLHTITSEGSFEGVLVLTAGDGEARHWHFTSTYFAPTGARAYIIGQAVDVTSHTRQVEELREHSLRDELTGAYNRRELRRFEKVHSGDHPWAVVTLDLDNFKGVNDTYGHDRGDQILIEIAEFLLQRIRAIDAVVRLGGDEFVILMADADARDVEGLVERLQHEAIAAPCAFSMGSALREHGEGLSATIARADAAMYAAKNAKRNV